MIIEPGTIVYDRDKTNYKVLNFIRSGAFGYVYKIEKTDDRSAWVLKTLPTAFQDTNLLKGLINEGNLATKVSHQNVIRYIFFHDGSLFQELPPYIIMEFADQGTLRQIIEQQKEKKEFITNNELKNYFTQLIDGMEAINTHLIHRDIKPDNILIKDDMLKISDFGLSKIVEEQTRTYTFKGFGHIRYMSPEGWKNEKNTIQMDIYSMGIVFYELATLRHPLEVVSGDDIQEWRQAHFFQNPKRPDTINQNLTSTLSQLISKMLEKSTSKRFKNWAEIRSELAKEESTPTSNTILIENLLKKRLDKDSKIKEEQLNREKRQKEIEEFRNLVKYQFEESILKPLKSFIEEFNRKYSGGKIQIRPDPVENRYTITLLSGASLVIHIRALIDEDFYREREIEDFGRKTRVRQLERPLFEDRKIMAWGYLKSHQGKGFNIILVEKEGDIYGDWFVLINTHNALSTQRERPEPFPFEFDEIEEEIKHIKAMRIYSTKVEILQLNHFVKFIEEYI